MDAPIRGFSIYTQPTPYETADGKSATFNVPLVELPAGTLLFRGVQLPNPKKDEDPRLFVRDWLGYPRGDRFCLTPTHNTFFYTTPFVPFGAHTVGEWFNAIMVYQLVKNVKVVAMIGPSKLVRGGKEIKALDGTAPIQRCDKLDYSCIENKSSKEYKQEQKQKEYDNCIHPDFAQKEKVSGWMAIADYDSLDNFKQGLKGKDTTMGKYIMELESRLPGKGIDLLTSTYTDDSGHRGFPEVVLYPWSPHPGTENQYTEARTEEDAADAIAEMSDKFTYLPIACITERGILEAFTGDFKAGDLPAYATSSAPGKLTRKTIDKYQAEYLEKLQKGIEIPGFGRSQLLFDYRTGFYVMDRFAGELMTAEGIMPYKDFCCGPMITQEEKETILEYKIRYRTFDQSKLVSKDTFIDNETETSRLFIFQRPLKLYPQFKELGIRLPSRFIPYIWGATELFQKNLANRKAKDDPRGAEEARRRAEEAKEKIQESLEFIAKKKQERLGKTTAPSTAAIQQIEKAEEQAAKDENKGARTPPVSTTPPFFPEEENNGSHTPPLPSLYQTKTPFFPKKEVRQTTIPILRTKEEALKIALEALNEPQFPQYYEQRINGRKIEIEGPFDMKEKSVRTTLNYIYDYMHHTCYMLCVILGSPFLYKLEGGGLPTIAREALETEMTKKGITDIDLNKTRIMQCIIKSYQQESSTAEEWLGFLKDLLEKGYELPNGIFILNLTDALLLRSDQNSPFGFFTKSLTKLEPAYYNKYWLPILGYSGNVSYDDIPIPNFDDLFEIKRNEDGSVNVNATLGGEPTLDWTKKETRAVFRGGTTGCGYFPDTNPRLALTDESILNSLEHKDMLDVGITTITKQYKMDPVYGLGKVDPNQVKVVAPLTMVQQSKAKFIIHVDGNVFAYRLLKTMLTGSCILRAMSPYKGWMDTDPEFLAFNIYSDDPSNLKNKCYIMMSPMLENLDDVLSWCLENDDICRQIAENGRVYAERALSRAYIYATFVNILNFATYVSALPPPDSPQKGGKKQKQTRKTTKKTKKTRKQRQKEQKEPLVLAEYRGGSAPDMDNYIQSTMKMLWERFAQKANSTF